MIAMYIGDVVMDFVSTVDMLFTCTASEMPLVDSIIVESSNRFALKSMSRPNFGIKSAPIIGVDISATVMIQDSCRRKLKSAPIIGVDQSMGVLK